MKICILTIILFSSNAFTNIDNIDPFESINRSIFDFNTTVDKNISEPAARLYKKTTPVVVQDSISNFFDNLSEIPVFFNQLAQFKLVHSFDTTFRFVINTTLGVGGIIDVATGIGLQKRHEDFGRTLDFYNVKSGPYLVVPFIGPSSLRDLSIIPVDGAINNFVNLKFTRNQNTAKYFIATIGSRARLLPQTDFIYNSEDPYIAMRSSYLQGRKFRAYEGNLLLEDIDF